VPRYEPKVGDVVLYRLTTNDVDQVTLARQAWAHKKGAAPIVGEEIAVMVTRVWASRVLSGQGILDGNDTIWIAQSGEGSGIGQWRRRE
jgi:hypothetical protein